MTENELMPRLPLSALAAFCPSIAASFLLYRRGGADEVFALLKRALDFPRIKSKIWYVPALLLAPSVAILSYAAIQFLGTTIPVPAISIAAALTLFVAFFVAALGEELGWSGYAIGPMQARWGALGASVILGTAWAVWHFVPLLEAHRTYKWIAWWSAGTISMRVIMVWLYNNTGKSVFSVAVLHATSNLAWQIFPVQGSYFDPQINGLILMCLAALIVIGWGPRTLAARRPPDLG